jgi:hypothetical protein
MIHFDNNLVIGSYVGPAVGISVPPGMVAASCAASYFSSFQHNAFVNLDGSIGTGTSHVVLRCADATTGTTVAATDMSHALSLLGMTASAQNFMIGACTPADAALNPAGCVVWPACPGADGTCIGSLLTTWSSDDGLSSLGAGWALAPMAPCRLATGAEKLSDVAVDFFGAMRAAMPSIGAAELVDRSHCK